LIFNPEYTGGDYAASERKENVMALFKSAEGEIGPVVEVSVKSNSGHVDILLNEITVGFFGPPPTNCY